MYNRYLKAFNLFSIHDPHVCETSSVQCCLFSVLQVNNEIHVGCYAPKCSEENSVS